MKKLWLVAACAVTMQAAQQPIESQFILHEGAKLTFADATRLFNRVGFSVLTTGKVVVTNPSVSLVPRVTYLRNAGSLNEEVGALNERVVAMETALANVQTLMDSLPDSFADSLAAMQLAVDTAHTEVTRLSGELAVLNQKTTQILETEMSSSEGVVLQAGYNGIKEQFEELERTTQEALLNLPSISGVSHVSDLSALAPHLQSNELTRGGGIVGVKLSGTISLPHSEVFEVGTPEDTKHMVLNGDDEALILAAGSGPQIRVHAGSTLELEHITIRNIHTNSIQLDQGATIILGEGVSWEIHEDLSFSAGSIVLSSEAQINDWRSIGGVRTVTLAAPTATDSGAMLDLGTSTLALHSIILRGAQQVVSGTSTDMSLVGALGLCGNSKLFVKGDLHAGVVAVGNHNKIICERSGARIAGPILFAPVGENELSFKVCHGSSEAAVCTFAPEALLVASERGNAFFRLTNKQVIIKLEAANSCIIGTNGIMDGQDVYISGRHSIVDATDSMAFSDDIKVVGSPDNVVAGSVPTENQSNRHTALHKKYVDVIAASVTPRRDMVHRGTLQMSALHDRLIDGVSHSVVVAGGTVEKWGIDEAQPAHIVLRDGAHLKQMMAPTVLKQADTITVYGKGNKITVNNVLTFKGQLICEEGSELTITCNQGAELLIDPSFEHSWHLHNDAVLKIGGEGRVRMLNSLHSFGAELQARPATFLLERGIVFSVNPGVTWKVSGYVTVALDTHALCIFEPGAQWWCGMSQSDVISVVLDRNSSILLGHSELSCPTDSDSGARWSMTHGTYCLNVQRDSMIRATNRSSIEINMRDGVATPGVCHELRFSQGGRLHLMDDSMLAINDNRLVGGEHAPLAWHEHKGGIYGDGLIGNSSMTQYGRCQQREMPTACRAFNGMALGDQPASRQMVKQLINLDKSLHSTLYFVNSEGTSMVHTVQHALVPLADDERITHDDAASGMVYGQNESGDTFTLRRNGTRV